MKKLLLFTAAILCLAGCNQNEPDYTAKGTYVDRCLNEIKLNSQEMFYAMAYSQAENSKVRA